LTNVLEKQDGGDTKAKKDDENYSSNNNSDITETEISSNNSSRISGSKSSHVEINTYTNFPTISKSKSHSSKCKSLDFNVLKSDEVNEVDEDEEEDKFQDLFKNRNMTLHFSFEKANIDNIYQTNTFDRSKTPKLNLLMDPVLEEKEEPEAKLINRLYSPRLKVYSDKVEDLNNPKLKSSHSHFFTSNTEVIAEDCDENIIEAVKINKRSNSKILESSMDKSDIIDNLNVDINHSEDNQITETILEDAEEDDIAYNLTNIQEKLEQIPIQIGDELDHRENSFKKRLSSKHMQLIDEEEIKEEAKDEAEDSGLN